MSVPNVLHETADWLVIDKPAGWHSVRGATAPSQGGWGVIEAWLPGARPELAGLPESGLVHRLDRDTSGCLVVARSREKHAELVRRLRDGDGIRKRYLARVQSGLPDDGDTTLYFSSRYKGSARTTVERTGAERHAGRFRWHVRERDLTRGDLVELELVGAGKRHQLRAGCAFLGHPLVGDSLYGGPTAATVQLHAWRIVIDGVSVEAPAPVWAAN